MRLSDNQKCILCIGIVSVILLSFFARKHIDTSLTYNSVSNDNSINIYYENE